MVESSTGESTGAAGKTGAAVANEQPMQLVAQAQHPMMVTAMPIMYAPPGAMFAQGGQPGMPTLVYMHPGGAGLQPALGYPAPVHMAQVSFMQPQ